METVVTSSPQVAAQFLRAGQTVIFPTETVYGLGANALDAVAVLGIYTAKNRPADNPLIVHIYSHDQIIQLGQNVPDYAWTLVEKFWPGPLTLLVYKQPIVPDTTTAGSDKVCLRWPSLPIAQEFLRECGLPVEWSPQSDALARLFGRYAGPRDSYFDWPRRKLRPGVYNCGLYRSVSSFDTSRQRDFGATSSGGAYYPATNPKLCVDSSWH